MLVADHLAYGDDFNDGRSLMSNNKDGKPLKDKRKKYQGKYSNMNVAPKKQKV